MHEINRISIEQLQKKYAADADARTFLQDALLAFSKYTAAIYQMEIHMILAGNDVDPDEHARLDEKRTNSHNAVIASIENLNRICEKNGITPVYAGTVSINRPHRVEIADAVLAYVHGILENRVR